MPVNYLFVAEYVHCRQRIYKRFSFYCPVVFFFLEPSSPPENVQGHNSSSTSISVKWDEVPAEKQNGEILNYTVMYGKTGGGEAEKRKQVNSPSRNVQLTNLAKYTSYSIRVLAATVKGDGPPSNPIQVRTDEDSKETLRY